MTTLQYAAEYALKAIVKNPSIAEEVFDLVKLLYFEIEDGASVDEELELFEQSVEILLGHDGFTGYEIAKIGEK